MLDKVVAHLRQKEHESYQCTTEYSHGSGIILLGKSIKEVGLSNSQI